MSSYLQRVFKCDICGVEGAVKGQTHISPGLTTLPTNWQFIKGHYQFIVCDVCSLGYAIEKYEKELIEWQKARKEIERPFIVTASNIYEIKNEKVKLWEVSNPAPIPPWNK